MSDPYILYLSYDGALDPLGMSQVVPYVEKLAQRGYPITLLTFEKPARLANAVAVQDLQKRLSASGTRWVPFKYHKAPTTVATAWDLARALLFALRSLPSGIAFVHARSYPPALVAWVLSKIAGVPYLFDIRGLYPEEKVEGGTWAHGSVVHKAAKRLEVHLFRRASSVVTLTFASRQIVEQRIADAGGRASVHVIPTCVDLQAFRPVPVSHTPNDDRSRNNSQLAADGQPRDTIAYVGSVGTFYLLDDMLAFGAEYIRQGPNARILMLLNDASGGVEARARALGIPMDRLEIKTVAYEGVPRELSKCSAIMCFIRPSPSKVASAATKFSEALAMGLPSAVNRGIGDAAEFAERDSVGIVVTPFDHKSFPQAATELRKLASDPGVAERCRHLAQEVFDLDEAVRSYDKIYSELLEKRRRMP